MTLLVVMGVSGSGKTTVGRMIASRLGWPFAEGDDFHSAANIEKMAHGNPLNDEDRWPWLRSIGAWIDDRIAAGESGVVTCSALKRSYRDVLRRPGVVFVFLAGDAATIARRISARHGHFMPVELLHSQLATLEPPDADEAAVAVDVALPPSEVVDEVVRALQRRRGA